MTAYWLSAAKRQAANWEILLFHLIHCNYGHNQVQSKIILLSLPFCITEHCFKLHSTVTAIMCPLVSIKQFHISVSVVVLEYQHGVD